MNLSALNLVAAEKHNAAIALVARCNSGHDALGLGHVGHGPPWWQLRPGRQRLAPMKAARVRSATLWAFRLAQAFVVRTYSPARSSGNAGIHNPPAPKDLALLASGPQLGELACL